MIGGFLLVVCASLLSYVCADSNAQLSEAANCFTLNFYKQLATAQSQNMVSSPFSLDVLLSMLTAGAAGPTAEELKQALGYQTLSTQEMQKAFKSKLASLESSDGNSLNIANSIWIDKGFTVKDSFKDVVTQYFDSTLAPADFKTKSHQVTQEINSWANKNTNGLIPKIFDEDLDPATIIMLVNAIYFKGTWQYEFKKEATYDGDFTSTPGKSTKAKFMNQKNSFAHSYDDTLNAEVLEMDYAGRNMSMSIILPTKQSNLGNLEQKLTCQNFMSGITSGLMKQVVVSMPKFEISSSYDLVEAIQNMGISKAFSDSADFSGISAEGMKVSQAIQKAIIKVYEEGSEAAVVTAIGGVRTTSVNRPEVIYFTADRPFIFMIRHKPSNLILFMGRVKQL